jgi:hypothetical protein
MRNVLKKVAATGAAVFAVALSGNVASANPPSDFVFVCKFVGTPGVDERLQTGNNPIRVNVNAIPGGAFVGAEFADAQGRSVVIAFDTGQEPEPECPAPENPGTTQPTQTTQPTETTQPTQTTQPTDTTQPTQPTETTQPGNTVATTAGSTPMTPAPQALPETGSSSVGVALAAATLVATGAGLMAAANLRRRTTST